MSGKMDSIILSAISFFMGVERTRLPVGVDNTGPFSREGDGVNTDFQPFWPKRGGIGAWS